MKCPSCGVLDNKVIDSRLAQGGEVTRRRRECDGCGRRYTTYEHVEEAFPLIIKKDGRRENYDRSKLLEGLRRACQKRPIPTENIERVVDAIERELQELNEREVPSSAIGERVMAHLRELDLVAYLRFASVYRSFDDIGEFLDELHRLTQKQRVSERLRAASTAQTLHLADPDKARSDRKPVEREQGNLGHLPNAESPDRPPERE
ncbi:MAG: hypothetical protein NVSMB1_17140 [Polyangiales bacterium]